MTEPRRDSRPSSPKRSAHELPVLHLDHEQFSFLKNYLPGDAAQQHGQKHGCAGNAEPLPALAALSPISADEADHCDKRQRRVPWTHTEDVTILALHRHLGTNWEAIASKLPGRTADAVRNRCFRLQKSHPIATTEEGQHALDGFVMVTHGISPPGEDAAPTMACASRTTSGSSVIEDPFSSHGASLSDGSGAHARHTWSKDEDRIIEDGVAKLGCKWREIAKSLPGRTDSSIRNRWMRLQKEKFQTTTEPAKLSPDVVRRQTSANATCVQPEGNAPPMVVPTRSTLALEQELGLTDIPAGSISDTIAQLVGLESSTDSLPSSSAIKSSNGPPAPVTAAGGITVPLGLESPYEVVDLAQFASLAFETCADDGVIANDVSMADAATSPATGTAAPVDLSDAGTGSGPPAKVPPGVRLASTFLGVFAALSLASTLARKP